MPSFLVDEDLPRSLAPRLRAANVGAEDVRDVGLRGAPDVTVFAHALDQGFVLLTGDLGFANILRFPLGSHHGIVVVRFPNEMSVDALNETVVRTVSSLSDSDVRGNLLIVEPGRVRFRRASRSGDDVGEQE